MAVRTSLERMMTAKFRAFSEKLLATEVAANALGEEWKSYMVRISGGNDKQGFLMKQGVLTHSTVYLHRARDILVLDQEELEREVQMCSRMYCGCQSE